MPTAFGRVGVQAASELSAGKVSMIVQLPERNRAKHAYLRCRVPDGWRVTGAAIGTMKLPVDDRGTIDLSGQQGEIKVVFSVAK